MVHTLPDSNISYAKTITGAPASHREGISCSMDMLKPSLYGLTKFKPRTDKYSIDEKVVVPSSVQILPHFKNSSRRQRQRRTFGCLMNKI
jgi:hypothetical protein